MEPLIQLRLLAVRLSMMLVLLAAAVAFAFDRIVAQGVAMGGIAGTLVFWITARRLERLAKTDSKALYSRSPLWALAQLGIFAAVLYKGYSLDEATFRGFFAAAAGLFVIRLVLVVLGLTGLDLKQEEK